MGKERRRETRGQRVAAQHKGHASAASSGYPRVTPRHTSCPYCIYLAVSLPYLSCLSLSQMCTMCDIHQFRSESLYGTEEETLDRIRSEMGLDALCPTLNRNQGHLLKHQVFPRFPASNDRRRSVSGSFCPTLITYCHLLYHASRLSQHNSKAN